MDTMQMRDSMSKRELVNVLYSASNILQRVEDINRELERVKAKYRPTEGGYKKLWHGMKPFGPKLLLVIVGAVLVMGIGKSFNSLAVILFDVFGLSANVSIFLVQALQYIIIILIPVLAQAPINKWIVKKNQKNADRLEYNKEFNKGVMVEEQAVQAKMSEVAGAYSQIAHLLPTDYKYNKTALAFMAKAIEQGRAENIGGAINLYEEEEHRKRVEKKLDEANRIAAAQVAATLAQTEAIHRKADAEYQHAAAAQAQADAMNRQASAGYYRRYY